MYSETHIPTFLEPSNMNEADEALPSVPARSEADFLHVNYHSGDTQLREEHFIES